MNFQIRQRLFYSAIRINRIWYVYQKRIQCLFIFVFYLFNPFRFTYRLTKIMDNQNIQLVTKLTQLPMRIFMRVIDYLGEEQLGVFGLAIQNQSDYQEISKVINVKLQYIKYINVFDRSYYLDIFSNQKYLSNENMTYYQLAQSDKYNQLIMFESRFQTMLQQATLLVPTNMQQQFNDKFKTIFIDPTIAMPRLHRQTVGYHVNSNFQSYLISAKDTQCGQFSIMDETFELIKQAFEDNQQNILRQMMQPKHLNKLRQIRYQSHSINFKNIKQFILGNSSLIDMIVYIMGLTDLYLEQIKSQLLVISDPLELLIQLTSRYMYFHNFVLGVQENFGYIFTMFDQLYSELYGSSAIKFSFYQPAFAKWSLKMSQFHPVTDQVYSSLLAEKVNTNTLKSNSILFSTQGDNYHQQVYEHLTDSCSDAGSLMSLYLEYVVDLSVDEQNINWCGHSQQKFGDFHKNLELSILGKQNNFMTRIYEMHKNKYISNEQIQDILRQRLLQFQDNVKKSTVRSISNFYDKIVLNKKNQLISFSERDRIIERANFNSNIKNIRQCSNKLNIDYSEQMDIQTTDSNKSDISDSSQSQLKEYESEDEQDEMQSEQNKQIKKGVYYSSLRC